MGAEVTADWLQQVLLRHDPLAAWSGTGAPGASDYRRVAELAAADLRQVLGVGHARTVVADALDRVHPGVYQALAAAGAGDEFSARLGRIAREIWDRSGVRRGAERARPAVPVLPPMDPPAIDELMRSDAAFTSWLRALEAQLADEVNLPGSSPGPAASALLVVLPQLVDAYLEAGPEQRASLRLACSRFRRVCYRLSSFAALQARLLAGPRGAEGLRRCLAAESLLDLNVDWRDELLLLQDVRRVAIAQGLAFETELARAAGCSSAETAGFLRQLLAAG